MTCKHQEAKKKLNPSEVVLGLTEAKVQELVDKNGCLINRTDLVPVVSIEERDSQVRKACIDGFAKGSEAGKEELVEWLEDTCRELVKGKGSEYTFGIIDLLEAVRLQVAKSKGGK